MSRESLQVLGRTIGTFDGWDGDDILSMMFYKFAPCDVLSSELPEGDICVNFKTGEFTYYNDDGTVSKVFDMLKLLNMVQKDPDNGTAEQS